MSEALHEAVLAAMPGTMKELAERTGVVGQPLWDTVQTLRKAGLVLRTGTAKEGRVFSRAPDQQPQNGVEVPPALAAKEEKKSRKRPVILFWIPGWPSQEPNRRMVWRICWEGMPRAQRDMQALKKHFRHEPVEWEIVTMSPAQARRLRAKGFDLREQREREQALREKADAAVRS